MSRYERLFGRKKQEPQTPEIPDNSQVHETAPAVKKKLFGLPIGLLLAFLLVGTLVGYMIFRDSKDEPEIIDPSPENLAALNVADTKFKEYLNCINLSVDSLIAQTSDSLRLIDIRTFKEYKENAIDMRYTLKMASVTQYDSLSFHTYTETLISDMKNMAAQSSIQLPNCPL